MALRTLLSMWVVWIIVFIIQMTGETVITAVVMVKVPVIKRVVAIRTLAWKMAIGRRMT